MIVEQTIWDEIAGRAAPTPSGTFCRREEKLQSRGSVGGRHGDWSASTRPQKVKKVRGPSVSRHHPGSLRTGGGSWTTSADHEEREGRAQDQLGAEHCFDPSASPKVDRDPSADDLF